MIITNLDKMPDVPCYGIVTIQSIYIPGDERSRTAPGHGYPAHSQNYSQLEIFSDKIEWENRIRELSTPKYGAPKSFRAFLIGPVNVDIKVEINVS